MKTSDFLAEILRDWNGALQQPKNAKAILFSEKYFPGFTGKLIREILLHGGDWRQTVYNQLHYKAAVELLPVSRVKAFAAWAEKITVQPVRGLLEWKGGVS